ncbi:PilZ domain-containing protein [Sphingomonas sp. dw_22]|uniref:PilZ domain-containing protein n=1 Tax=Sphingomonas sp. dw_22 TaxID=2721175 RepID=UPI001BD4DAE6|nr:PilZ domain-containing protein [Sphingomonas sp. dw_22]
MGLVAYLYRDARWAERHQVERDATLRDPDWSPIDVTVEDLSEGGFRVVAETDLPIGAEIGLGLAGIGLHSARVVRRSGNAYGCEFLPPLTSAELRAALSAPAPDPVALPIDAATYDIDIEDEEHPDRLPLMARLLAISAGAIMAWAIVLGIGWILVEWVRSALLA